MTVPWIPIAIVGLQWLRDRHKEGGSAVWFGLAAETVAVSLFVVVRLPGRVTAPLDQFGFPCDLREAFDWIGRARGLRLSTPRGCGGSTAYWTMIEDHDGHRDEFTYSQPLLGLAANVN